MSGSELASTDRLEPFEICAELPAEEKKIFASYLSVESLGSGDWLFRESDPGDRLFLVETGSLTAYVMRSDGKELALASFVPGSFFGEMALIDGEPRSAGCRAESKSRLLSIDRSSFFSLKREHPEIAFHVMRRMLLDTKGRLSNTTSFVSDLVQLGEAARKRAITDDLTGLYNRRYLDSTLDSMVADARRGDSFFSLVMIDLDHFSSINDEYGQAKGDEVLHRVVGVFESVLRGNDIAARYGGDEFNIIFPGTDATTSLDICNVLCENVSRLDVLADTGGMITWVTTSQGIATFPKDGDSVESIREAADAALYQAKEAGRNCVVHASTQVSGSSFAKTNNRLDTNEERDR